MEVCFSQELDAQVPQHRNNSRSVRFRVNDAAETDSSALVVVRIVFERGGSRQYFVLKCIEDIAQFYPKALGRNVVEEVLTLWAEHLLTAKHRLSNFTLINRQNQPTYKVRYHED